MWPVLLRNAMYTGFLLGIMSLIAFGLSRQVPGDVVLDYLSIDEQGYASTLDPASQREAYQRVAQRRGLDLPVFYLSLQRGYYPDSLFRIFPLEDRQRVRQWIDERLDGPGSLRLYRLLRQALSESCRTPAGPANSIRVCNRIQEILLTRELTDVHRLTGELLGQYPMPDSIAAGWARSLTAAHRQVEAMIRAPRELTGTEWLPALRWHGAANQYHQWMAGLLLFRPLTSLVDGRNAWTKIGEAVRWTLIMNALALVLALGLGMAIGIWSGAHDGQVAERLVNTLLFVLFALPSFWLATLLIAAFASGEWLNIFPAGGLGPYERAPGIFQRWGILIRHLTLPVWCMALGALAYVSRQMKMSVTHQLRQPYVGYMLAQGISRRTILRRHVVRNALFPMITLVGSSIPALLSGSLLMEVIFSIPGMGRLLYNSLMARDWPVVFPILMISAAVTIIAYVLTDLAYKWADPRIKTRPT